MCTVTYIPQGNSEFVITSNRDENQSRATSVVDTRPVGSEKILFPVDPVSGGSWIAISASNRAACVLNGAWHKHQHRPPYSRSRGLVLLDYFQWPGFSEFSTGYDFSGIEPFTMVVCEQGKLITFRWDGNTAGSDHLDPDTAHIWSSPTLYDEDARSSRERWFRHWLRQHNKPQVQDQLNFHQYGGEADATNGLVINRENKVQTLSITAIDKKRTFATLEHKDLILHKSQKHHIDFSENGIMETH